MSPTECEVEMRELGFHPMPGARLMQIDNHMVPFVNWHLGEDNVAIYYHWPGREYAESVIERINALNFCSMDEARGIASVFSVIQFCS